MFIIVSTSGQRWSLQAPAKPGCGKQNRGSGQMGCRSLVFVPIAVIIVTQRYANPEQSLLKGQTALNERLPNDEGQQN